ncbi:hypothetical protein [Candidatus Nitrosotalea bavarica]|uniref:hypothetical protein n=1 Tax=Candidatus Nitrosotalea bavarica TaxID=1903277 RepID=UPI000C70E00F|nr:hypothetical protein [Candidatus Nitrosotalea bavarica]
MVFGFGKKKVEEHPTTTQKERVINIEEIPGILQEVQSPHITQAINIAKSVRDEVETHKKKIHSLILQLESDDLKLDDIDRNLMMIVKRGKNSIVSIIKKETVSGLTNATKYDQVILLNTEISQTLKRIGDVLGLNSRIIHIFAKKYADNLKEEIAKIASKRNQLQVAINLVEDLKVDGENMIETGKKITEEKSKIIQKTNRVSEIISELDTLKNNFTSLEKQIHDLKSMKEHTEYLEIKNSVESLSSEKNQIKNIIDMQFSKISRPLDKYRYISAFEKPVKKMMDELVSNPYEVISAQNKPTIIQILEAVAKSVSSASISVKDTDKSLEQIMETISRLDEFITLKESHSSKVSTLEKDLIVFDIKLLESKEHSLHKAKMNFTNMESVKKKLEEEITEDSNLLEKHVSEIESDLARVTKLKIILKK